MPKKSVAVRMKPLYIECMHVKKVTIKEVTTSTYIIPENVNVDVSTHDMAEIRKKVKEVTDKTELMKVSDRNSTDVTVEDEEVTGLLIDKVRNFYDHLKN